MKKRIISILLALVLCVGMLPVVALGAEIVASGECGAQGDNVTWTLDSNGTLMISGSGEMADYITIGYKAPWYSRNTSIQAIVIESGITSIGASTFESCNNLTSVTIPDSVTSIGNSAFSRCSRLTEITIPDSVKYIGDAFYGCSSLTNVTIPDRVKYIGGYTFADCSILTSVTIGENVAFIQGYAFSNCSSLTSITIGNSVTSIGEYAFSNCSSLISIAIPDSVKSIGYHAFEGCSSLDNVTIPDSVTFIGYYVFYGCSSLTGVTIGNNVTSIGECAFEGCSSLISITIPDSVTSIQYNAFCGCSGLTSVTIPDNVTSIGESAFEDCSSLTDVYYNGTKEQWNMISIGIFNHPLLNATIHYAGDVSPAVPAVTLNENSLELNIGATATLTATVLPEDATDKTVTWTSSDPAVATVENGVITAVAAGSATITAAAGGQSATCAVTVTASADPTPVDPTPVDPTPVDPTPQPHNPFTDVPLGEWFTDAVLWAVEHGITNGTSDTTFSPGKGCTRGQVATFLWRAFGSITPKITVNPFDDVKDGEYYFNPVLWAVENGVTNGVSKDAFGPKNTCTRGQVVTFLWRAAGPPEPESKTNPFTDVKTTDYFYKAVLWAVENGITNGTSDTTFSPGNTCTRAHVVTFLYRAMT